MFNRKSSNRRGIRESQKGIKMPKNGLVEGVGATAKIDDSFKDETNDKLSKLENDYFNFKGKGIPIFGGHFKVRALSVQTEITYPLQDGFDGLNQQIKDENRKMSSIEGDISDIMVSNESINMKINNYEAENIELKAKCDELKRTGK